MNPVVLHFIDGRTFFYGVGILLIVCLVWMKDGGWRWNFFLRILTAVAVLLVVLSSTPLPLWFYLLWGIPVIGMLAGKNDSRETRPARFYMTRAAAMILSVAALVMEIPYHLAPVIRIGPLEHMVVIGDSICSEDWDRADKWPSILGKKWNAEVINLSQSGAGVHSAIRGVYKLKLTDPGTSLAIVEIGGNDVLCDTRVRSFEAKLDEILGTVRAQCGHVVVLELPLPPLYNRFGEAQRRLAEKHGAILIPKRYFAQVLGAKGATSDGLHLSQAGHKLAAEILWDLLAGKTAD